MLVNRRDALRAGAGLIASALLPAIPASRPAIDLSVFTDPHAIRYDLSQPFRQGGLVYATDGRVCVRTDSPAWLAEPGKQARLPPVTTLDWAGRDAGGWSSFCNLRRVPTHGVQPCPLCDGRERIGPDVRPCPECEDEPECHDPAFEDWVIHDLRCSRWIGGSPCDYCDNGHVDWAWEFGGNYFAPRHIATLRALPGASVKRHNIVDCCGLAVRFEGGEALLMPLDMDRSGVSR